MVVIYVKKYKAMIESSEMTVDEAIADAKVNVPIRWREAVIDELEKLS